MRYISPQELQLTNEHQFSTRNTDKKLYEYLQETPEIQQRIEMGVDLLTAWTSQEFTYETKIQRIEALKQMDFKSIVLDVFVTTAYYQSIELLVSASVKLAMRLGFNLERAAITTAAELLTVLAETDVYDFNRYSANGSWYVISRLRLPEPLADLLARARYLPPMVCKPKDITNNFQSPYLSFNDSIFSGKAQGHSGNTCLDVINTQNQTALSLNIDFLKTVKERPKKEFDDIRNEQNWEIFLRASYQTYIMLYKQGNEFWFHNKPDKRGRTYAQGYHVDPQGSAYKKAMLELSNKEVVEGVPVNAT